MLQLNVPHISSKCAADKPQCVEAMATEDGVEVRDTKEAAESKPLVFTHNEWTAFTEGVKAGEFDFIR